MKIQQLLQSCVLQSLLCKNTQRMILLSLVVLGGVCDAGTEETLSAREGDSVILQTNLSEILNDDTVLWAFGTKESVISQISKKNDLPILFFTDDVSFSGRLQVDQTTGSLTIRNIRRKHSGQYKLTISSEQTTSRIFHLEVLGVVGETAGVKSASVMEGESVFLQMSNDAEVQKDDLIVWRFGEKGILLATYDVETNELSLPGADERFRNRLYLNQTGSLTIIDTRTEHSGLYEVQVIGRGSPQQFLVSVRGDEGLSSAVIVGIVVTVLLVAGFVAAVVIYFRRRISEIKKQEVSETEGRTVVLKTDTELRNGDKIKWWFGDTLIAEKDKWEHWNIENKDIDYNADDQDERFRNKLQLGHKNGDLIISYIRTIHSGVYTVQIRGKIRTRSKRFLVTVSVENVPVKVGESVLLQTNIESREIKQGDLILWTFGVKNRLVVKHDSGNSVPPTTSESYRERVDLNKADGSLTIKDITPEDFGYFQLQVVNDERNRFRRFNLIKVEEVFAKVGNSITLQSHIKKQKGDEILWTFKDEDNVKYNSGNTTLSERFRGRLQLRDLHANGISLTITNITAQDFGHFKLTVTSDKKWERFRRFDLNNTSTGTKEKESLLGSSTS